MTVRLTYDEGLSRYIGLTGFNSHARYQSGGICRSSVINTVAPLAGSCTLPATGRPPPTLPHLPNIVTEPA